MDGQSRNRPLVQYPGYLIDLEPVIAKFKLGHRCAITQLLEEAPVLAEVLSTMTPQEIISCELCVPEHLALNRIVYELLEYKYPELLVMLDEKLPSEAFFLIDILFDMIVAEADAYVRRKLTEQNAKYIENYVFEAWLNPHVALFSNYDDRQFFETLNLNVSPRQKIHERKNLLLHQRQQPHQKQLPLPLARSILR